MKYKLGLVLAAFSIAAMGTAQSISFAQALDGKRIPAVIKPKELPADYWAVKITISGETSLLDLYGGAFAFQFRSGGGDDERQRAREALLQNSGVYWTKGEKVQIGNGSEATEYLIAYKLDIPILAFSGAGSSFDTWAMENPLDLSLQLIKPDSIAKMTPVPTLSPEKMSKAVDAFTRTLAEEIGVAPESFSLAANSGATSLRSRQTAALSNVKQIALGLIMYQADYDDLYPPKPSTENVKNVIRPYLKNDNLWKTGNPNKSRFLFNPALAGHSVMDVEAPANMPMLYEDLPWPDGRRAIAYADGHAKLISNNEWNSLSKLLRAKIPTGKRIGNATPKPNPPKARRQTKSLSPTRGRP